MLVKTIQHNGLQVEIHTDDSPESPRTSYDNVGTILYTSSRYALGDKQVDAEEIREITKRKDVVWLPVYAYIHSGTTISTTPFSCAWDSGQCGIIYVEKDKIFAEWHQTRLTKKLREKVKRVLAGEIETYDQFLRGDIYGYEVKRVTHCAACGVGEEEILEACWGFYGEEYCEEEALAAAQGHERKAG